MASDEIKRNRILDFSFKKFTSVGVNNITMDEIAKGVGIGKGTLYQYFPSKEELLYSTIEHFAGKIEESVNEIMSDSNLLPVDKLNRFFRLMGERFSLINPLALEHIERSFPEAFGKITEIRSRVIMVNLLGLFEEGKASGIFRNDMDSKLVAHILVGAANHIVDAKIIASLNYSLDNLLQSIISTVLKGCLTEEGRISTFGK